METRNRLELIIERMAVNRACNILEGAGLTGYTILPAISGFGGNVRWSRDTDLSASGDMVVIVSIGTEACVQKALAELNNLLGSHIGVLSVGQVGILRPERF